MLPSQSNRPVGFRSNASRRRGRGRPIGRIVVVIGLLVAGWFAVQAILPAGETNADTDAAGDDRIALEDRQSPTGETALSQGSTPDRDVADQSRNARASATEALATNEKSAPTITVPQNFEDRDQSSNVAQPELIMGAANPDAPEPGTAATDTPTPTDEPEYIAPPDPVRTAERVQKGIDLIKANRLVDARLLLSRALASGSLSRSDAQYVRKTLTELNDRLIFSPEIARDDEYAVSYTIAGGDSLERIVNRMALQVDWRFVQRINRIENPRNIRQGDRLKLVTGPFHAVVDKSDYTLDLYLGEGDAQVYVRTFPVGLGKLNSTPVGLFRIRPRSKLVNPAWTNPRTREPFAADDPNNPIGEHWLGLEGISEAVRNVSTYGIHGTIEPDSIGQQASMGCVRMHADDVAIIYEVLTEGASTVRIQD